MLILTCDDGVFSEGFKALVRGALNVLSPEELILIGPEEERSASSHSLTFFKPIYLYERKLKVEDIELRAFVTDGTPADNVIIALYYLLGGKENDIIVLSGINRGANLGYDIHYSGTVSAALEASLKGGWGIAFSLAEYENPDYSTSEKVVSAFLKAFLRRLTEDNFSALRGRITLNVNIPSVSLKSIRGISLTRAGRSIYRDRVILRVNPRGRKYLWLGGDYPWGESSEGTDFSAIRDNLISVTPIDVNPTWSGLLMDKDRGLNEKLMETLREFLRDVWRELKKES